MNSFSIFKNEDVLSPEYLPEILPHRETQIRQIASNLEPVGKGRKGQNTFVFGSPGIGKTATAKFIFRKFEEEYSGIKTIYINCWDFNTSIAVLSKITNDLGVFVQRRGMGKDEINQKFVESLSKAKSNVVVCLDEVDQLILKESGALYNLLRIDQYTQKSLPLVLISNNPHIFSKLESRVLSSLNADGIEFKPYNFNEMKKILEERARHAFVSIDNAAIALAANLAVQRGGDVRIGLQCLQKAGRLAEREGGRKLLAKHVKEIFSDVKDARLQILEKKVSESEKALVKIVNRSGSLSFTELYKKYAKGVENPASVRMVQDYVRHLAQAKMIKLSERKVDGKRIIYKAA